MNKACMLFFIAVLALSMLGVAHAEGAVSASVDIPSYVDTGPALDVAPVSLRADTVTQTLDCTDSGYVAAPSGSALTASAYLINATTLAAPLNTCLAPEVAYPMLCFSGGGVRALSGLGYGPAPSFRRMV